MAELRRTFDGGTSRHELPSFRIGAARTDEPLMNAIGISDVRP